MPDVAQELAVERSHDSRPRTCRLGVASPLELGRALAHRVGDRLDDPAAAQPDDAGRPSRRSAALWVMTATVVPSLAVHLSAPPARAYRLVVERPVGRRRAAHPDAWRPRGPIATRCWLRRPESCAGKWSRRSPSPTRESAAAGSIGCSAIEVTNSTFSRAVSRGDQVVELEHENRRARAGSGSARRRRRAVRSWSRKWNRAAGRDVETAQDVEQGRLAAARRTEHHPRPRRGRDRGRPRREPRISTSPMRKILGQGRARRRPCTPGKAPGNSAAASPSTEGAISGLPTAYGRPGLRGARRTVGWSRRNGGEKGGVQRERSNDLGLGAMGRPTLRSTLEKSHAVKRHRDAADPVAEASCELAEIGTPHAPAGWIAARQRHVAAERLVIEGRLPRREAHPGPKLGEAGEKTARRLEPRPGDGAPARNWENSAVPAKMGRENTLLIRAFRQRPRDRQESAHLRPHRGRRGEVEAPPDVPSAPGKRRPQRPDRGVELPFTASWKVDRKRRVSSSRRRRRLPDPASIRRPGNGPAPATGRWRRSCSSRRARPRRMPMSPGTSGRRRPGATGQAERQAGEEHSIAGDRSGALVGCPQAPTRRRRAAKRL